MESFTLGTGASIYTQKLLPALLTAKHEVILVTCFWAHSKTLEALCNALEQLARRRKSQQPTEALRVRICFSSRSLFQKLFHPSSNDGYIYPPSSWVGKLCLPSPEILAAGNIDLCVKSLFFLPFSVMHPKFLVVDRCRAFVPSCNVSWESWLEGCLEFSRRTSSDDPIDGLLEFYRRVWDPDLELSELMVPLRQQDESEGETLTAHDQDAAMIKSPTDTSVKIFDIDVPSSAIEWLPSWHHRNPSFSLFPWKAPSAPKTPLNDALLRLFEEADREIYLQTPNLTSPPVLSAIIEALARGVDVTIVTSRGMMVLEQLLTAGTTTGWCIRGLARRYRQLCEKVRRRTRHAEAARANDNVDLEAQITSPYVGSLRISYFRARTGPTQDEEPVHSHLKLSIFDSKYTVLGSGNMDRASWFTSQELGVLIYSTPFAAAVKSTVDKALEGRLDLMFAPS